MVIYLVRLKHLLTTGAFLVGWLCGCCALHRRVRYIIASYDQQMYSPSHFDICLLFSITCDQYPLRYSAEPYSRRKYSSSRRLFSCPEYKHRSAHFPSSYLGLAFKSWPRWIYSGPTSRAWSLHILRHHFYQPLVSNPVIREDCRQPVASIAIVTAQLRFFLCTSPAVIDDWVERAAQPALRDNQGQR